MDDDADDRIFLKEAISEIDPEVSVVLAENGLEALAYLGGIKEVSQLPCLVVLDINMPFLDGKETFKRIRKENNLQGLPVIVLTSSEKPADKLLFNNLGAEFLTKPSDIRFLRKIARHMVSVYCSRPA